MNSLTLTGTASDLAKSWAVYIVRDGATASVVYVGHCRLVSFAALPDLQGNPSFNPDAPLIVSLEAVHPDRAAAINLANGLIICHNRPALNRSSCLRRHATIECVDTGERWSSAAEAARCCGISPAHLANHLNRRPGYNTVNNRVYRRVLS
jgi:hypothetical protein